MIEMILIAVPYPIFYFESEGRFVRNPGKVGMGGVVSNSDRETGRTPCLPIRSVGLKIPGLTFKCFICKVGQDCRIIPQVNLVLPLSVISTCPINGTVAVNT